MLRFQVLWFEVLIHAEAPEVLRALEYLAQSADQTVEVRRGLTYDVERVPSGYAVLEDGVPVGTVRDAHAVLEVVYQRVHEVVFSTASRDGWVRLHAGLATVRGRRILLAGTQGVGKTTLILRLLVDGVAVESDESVLVRDGVALAVPRPFHVKQGVTEHIPEIASILDRLPRLPDERPVWALDLTSAGYEWRIAPGILDAVVVLRRVEPGLERLQRVSASQVMHDIVHDVFWLHEAKATIVREVATILRGASTFLLGLGDVRASAACLQEVVEAL